MGVAMINEFPSISHFALCKKTAEWAAKKNQIALYDYQSFATSEFPDVLAFNNHFSTLYEIKISRADFLSDAKKDCRKQYKIKYDRSYYWGKHSHDKMSDAQISYFNKRNLTEKFISIPHMGVGRYYVSPKNLIYPDEVGPWGLIWFNGRFSIKKESKTFKRNLYDENAVLVHALRKQKNGEKANVIAKNY